MEGKYTKEKELLETLDRIARLNAYSQKEVDFIMENARTLSEALEEQIDPQMICPNCGLVWKE